MSVSRRGGRFRRPALALLVIFLGLAAVKHVLDSRRCVEPGAFSSYRVNIGGRVIPVVDLRPCRATSTVAGMEQTLRCIENKLQLPSRPNVLIAQPGLGSSIYIERQHFAATAAAAHKDVVISADMTDQFKWPWESGDIRMVRIDEETGRRLERLVVAIRRVWGRSPDAVFESQATRLIVPGAYGSVTLCDMAREKRLDPEFKLNSVVCVGVPLRGLEIDQEFRKKHIGRVLAFTTPSATGLISSEPLAGEPSVEILQRSGKAVRHKYLFADILPDGHRNPIPNLTAAFLMGGSPEDVRKKADAVRF